MRRRRIASAGLLPLALAAWSCAAQQRQSRPEFLAVLMDTASKQPVPSARIILAPKKEGKHECTIDTSLTGVSNDRGQVRIPNVGPGEYVVFYNLSGSLKPELKGKVVIYGGPHDPRARSALTASLGSLIQTKEAALVIFDGGLSIANGGFKSTEFDLWMTTTAEGGLLTVRVPSAGSALVKIEIITDLPQPNPPRGAPKTGQ